MFPWLPAPRFWSYDVRGIQAADVVPWHGGAAVDVAIEEAGQLRSREGLLADSYDTNYIMRWARCTRAVSSTLE